MTVEQLYIDDDLDLYIQQQAWRYKLEFDDSKQDIFVEIIQTGVDSIKNAKRKAKAYFEREYRAREKDTIAISNPDTFEDDRDYDSQLWEDSHII